MKERGKKATKAGYVCIALGPIWFDLHENEATH